MEQYGHSWPILVGAPALLDFGGFRSLPVLMELLPEALGLGIPKVRERAALVWSMLPSVWGAVGLIFVFSGSVVSASFFAIQIIFLVITT